MSARNSGALDSRFVEKIRSLLGAEAEDFFAKHDSNPPTSVLMNPAKNFGVELPLAENVPWCPSGWYLQHRPKFTFEPQFHAGCYYVMEASSMFVSHIMTSIIADTKPLHVLDLCAAPGGKSVVLLTSLPAGSVLVVNEVNAARFNALQHNIDKWGAPNVVRSCLDPEHIPCNSIFDIILVDAPCSGEGLFRKDKEARAEWSPAHVELCSARQRRILSAAVRLLASGGKLIYATCTYNDRENIEQVDWMSKKFSLESLSIPIPNAWNIVRREVDGAIGYHFFPHLLKGEGFFCALLQKPVDADDENERIHYKVRSTSAFEVSEVSKELSRWIQPISSAGPLKILTTGVGRKYLLQSQFDLEWLQGVSRLHPGTVITDKQSSFFSPAHALAVSQCLHPDIPHVDLDRDEAIMFLRKETLMVEVADRGWCVARYKGHALGWLKKTHSGLKNYLPTKLRILKH